MKMTDSQQALLDSLVCQRLTADPKNQFLLSQFYSDQGGSLVNYLQERAWEEDLEGTTAFYVVKNPENRILMFFSLKCGALFDPLDEAQLGERIAAYLEILDAIRASRDADRRDAAMDLLEQVRSNHGIPLDQLEFRLRMGVKHKKHTLREIRSDKAHEPNEMIVRVGETHPGIELVHFCVNDRARPYWQWRGMTRPMGEVLFWWFVAPIIYEVQRFIGCQYVYLFAADLSRDRTLINYYEVALNFRQPDDIGTSKPRYDFQCEFMCQNINDLRRFRQAYLDHCNPDPDEACI